MKPKDFRCAMIRGAGADDVLARARVVGVEYLVRETVRALKVRTRTADIPIRDEIKHLPV